MQDAPILRDKRYNTAEREAEGYRPGQSVRLVVNGGLHMIHGNRKPYFSLTCTGYVNGRDDFGGAAHELIVSHFPELADLAAMHLSDIDGVPMHAEANGWYWLAGYWGDTKEPYTGATGSSGKSAEECLAIFAKHIRLSVDDARMVIADYLKTDWSDNLKARRKAWASLIDEMRGRWKTEADACIAKHGLIVYGGPYTPAT